MERFWSGTPSMGRWSGATAAALYTDVIKPALQGSHRAKRRYCMLEASDTAGNRSSAGKRAKVAAKIEVPRLPKRSPDLNVLDFSVWAEVERWMRRQERRWPVSKRETRAEFIRRLGRVGRGLLKKFIDDSISDMPRRCERLFAAKGGPPEEAGRRRRPL